VQNAVDSLNAGMGFVNHNGHGWYSVMVLGEREALSCDDFMGLENSSSLGILYSVGCWCGAFDFECIGEAYVRAPLGGGVAFLGNSRYGWGSPGHPGYGFSDVFDETFWLELFKGSYHIGEAFSRSKLMFVPLADQENVYRWEEFQLNLIGDPEMCVWVYPPRVLSVDLPEWLPCGQVVSFSIFADVDSGMVCLSGKGVYERAVIRGGRCMLNLPPVDACTLDVVITSPYTIPFEGKIPVIDGEMVVRGVRVEMGRVYVDGWQERGGEVCAWWESVQGGDISPCTLHTIADGSFSIGGWILHREDSIVLAQGRIVGVDTLDVEFRDVCFGLEVESIDVELLDDGMWECRLLIRGVGGAPFYGDVVFKPVGTVLEGGGLVPVVVRGGETVWVERLFYAGCDSIPVVNRVVFGDDTLSVPFGKVGFAWGGGENGWEVFGDGGIWVFDEEDGCWYTASQWDYSEYAPGERAILVSPGFSLPPYPVFLLFVDTELPLYGGTGMFVKLVCDSDTAVVGYIGAGGALKTDGAYVFYPSVERMVGKEAKLVYDFSSDRADTGGLRGIVLDSVCVASWCADFHERVRVEKQDLYLRPLPCSGEVVVCFPKDAIGRAVEVYDILGRFRKSFTVQERVEYFPVDDLPVGVYFLVAHLPRGRMKSAKFVVIR